MIKQFFFMVISYSVIATILYYLLFVLNHITNNANLSLIIVLIIAIGVEISYDDDKSDKL